MSTMHVPQGAFTLERYPAPRDRSLRAWDAADELALRHLAEDGAPVGQVVAILNDAFGALTAALATHRPTTLSDSYLAGRALEANLVRNAIDPGASTRIAREDELPLHIDLVLVKVPKSSALLEDQLRRARQHLHPGTVVLGAAMTRHIHTSTLSVFERVLGPVRTSLAHRKARLIHGTMDPACVPGPWGWPSTFEVDGDGVTVVNEAGVFSAASLDVGTRLLLEHVPGGRGDATIVDLGCGNGVVGATAQARNPGARLTFIDESFRAVASARATYRASFGHTDARFVAGDALMDLADPPPLAPGSVDLVLLNPPFHTGHVVGDETAWTMFEQSRAALRAGGELWVVGNRHLGYHTKLTRLFGRADVVASTPKFVLLRARRSR